MSEPRLVARDVELDLEDGARTRQVLRGIGLSVAAGEFVGLMGPSGSGKSSLLFVLSGLRAPTKGSVEALGAAWPNPPARGAAMRRRSLGLVLQDPFLIPYLTVRENAEAQALDEAAHARIAPLAESLGIAALLDAFPEMLSTGERQRASILRALVNDPAIVLADEPTAHLDAASGLAVIDLLARSAERAALLVTSHDPRMLERAGRVLRLADGALGTA